MGIAPSNIIALVASTAVNFTMNRSLAFKSSANPARSLVLYLVLFAFNTTFSTLAITWLVGLGVHSAVAKLMTMVCIVMWNFVLYRKVIFKIAFPTYSYLTDIKKNGRQPHEKLSSASLLRLILSASIPLISTVCWIKPPLFALLKQAEIQL